MADNTTLPGTGESVASDDIGGVKYQRVKISLGADGAAADLAPGQGLMAASVPVAIASNQSAVPVSGTFYQATQPVSIATAPALVASDAVIGLVGSSDLVVTVTPTCHTSAFAAGDLIFDSTAVANAVRANGGHAILQSITVIDKADQKAPLTLVFADAETDFGTLNSAPDPDDTETATVIGFVRVNAADYIDLGGAAVACPEFTPRLFKAGAATTSIYVAGVNGVNTPTYGASDLVLQLGFLRS